MTEIDLHLHTTRSDGTLTPTELVRMCAERGLRIISITDHDSTEGLSEAFEAASSFPQLTIIPGIELSTDIPGNEIHVLGYFVDYESPDFQAVLERFQEGRENRGRKMVEKLNELGVNISWARVQEISDGGSIGRPHIAQAMVEDGYVQYPKDAFDKYIGRNGVAYVDRLKLTPADAVQILIDNGALPVMAHPTYSASRSGMDEVDSLDETIEELKEVGLVGMEVYYKDYTPEQTERLAMLADKLGLIPCGGTDYHAAGNPDEPEPGSVGPPMETIEALKSLKKARV